MITVVTGPMRSGKSEFIIKLLNSNEFDNKNIRVFYPKIMEKENGFITSSDGSRYKAIPISDIINIYPFVVNTNIVVIDEFQFIDNLNYESRLDFFNFIEYCISNDINLILSGLDLDFRSQGFEIVKEVLCIADKVIKLNSNCDYCDSKLGRRCIRYVNNKVANHNDEVIQMETEDIKYKTACVKCYKKIYR
ncbi:MAG: hypothetical protein GQ557_01890 [Mycoplasmataceae bacterium]|nr:hypothetical protein [Mycoplasmataceae bacterium]